VALCHDLARQVVGAAALFGVVSDSGLTAVDLVGRRRHVDLEPDGFAFFPALCDSPLTGERIDQEEAATVLVERLGMLDHWWLTAGIVDFDSDRGRLAKRAHGHRRTDVAHDIADELAGQDFGDFTESVELPSLQCGPKEASRFRRRAFRSRELLLNPVHCCSPVLRGGCSKSLRETLSARRIDRGNKVGRVTRR
jgi:hypothetical protein